MGHVQISFLNLYESKFILELVYIVSVSREIFKIHGRQR